MRIVDTIEVKSNLILTLRERGKIVARRQGHNIWLNLGRNYLAGLIAYSNFTPLTPERDDRIRYMGLGIGGTRQNAPSVANNPPLSTSYPGTNLQTDTDPTIQGMERPGAHLRRHSGVQRPSTQHRRVARTGAGPGHAPDDDADALQATLHVDGD
jgi:hypothetical protein